MAKQLKVLYFSTFVSQESGATHAMRETIKRVGALGIGHAVAIPECGESRNMFPAPAFEAHYLNIRRPRKTLNPVTHARFLLGFAGGVLGLRRLILRSEADVVHCNEITDLAAAFAARSCGVPCVCTVRADEPSQPYRSMLLKALAATADAIVVPSKSAEAWVAAGGPELAAKVRLIYDYAFDASEYAQPKPSEVFRKELGVAPGATIVVLVSKLIAQKGHEQFLRAAHLVAQKRRDVVFVVVGGPVPGHEPEAEAIRKLGADLLSPEQLRFVGPRRDLPSIYSGADVVVHCPNFHDTYPTVVLLPMLVGKPVIGTRIGGIPEQIDDGRTGLLVPPDDATALASAIQRLVSDAGLRGRLGSAAMRKLRSSMAPQSQGRYLAQLYDEVLNKDPHRARGRGRLKRELDCA